MNIITGADILQTEINEKIARDYYYGLLTGNGGQTCCRLYLDLHDNTLSESCEASCNTWSQRDDDSLVEIDAHNCYGADLTSDELKWLEQNGVNDFGYFEWAANAADKIDQELNHWRTIDTENHQV